MELDAGEDLERAIERAEAEVKRWEAAVLAARDEEEAERARERLTAAELTLEDLIDRRPEGASCEGWPRGK